MTVETMLLAIVSAFIAISPSPISDLLVGFLRKNHIQLLEEVLWHRYAFLSETVRVESGLAEFRAETAWMTKNLI